MTTTMILLMILCIVLGVAFGFTLGVITMIDVAVRYSKKGDSNGK